jgi:replication fork clamp-binding protein CrfC
MVYEKTLKEPYAYFVETSEKTNDFAKVKDTIEKITDRTCGNRKNIIDKPIIMDVYSPNCPNLTIIDLPGLTRIPVDGQDTNIHQITTNIIRKYMEEPSTIILCVLPANEDITNDEVLHMARSVDQIGERTIGCVTKIDIMDRGTDARSLLLNEGEVKLKLGYVGIKNRCQADINEKKTVALP